MQTIRPCLWFDDQAEAAAEFYVSVFGGRVLHVSHYPEGAPRPAGMVMMVLFEIRGQEFMALNGGPEFTLTPAVSFMVACDTQDDLDRIWERLSEGGEPNVCGWVTDKFGVSWQVDPAMLDEWLTGGDAAATERALKAVWQMAKLDIDAIKQAYEGES